MKLKKIKNIFLKHKPLILSAVAVIVSVSIMATVIYGWFVQYDTPDTGGFDVELTSGVGATLKIKHNDTMMATYRIPNALPRDEFTFYIEITSSNHKYIRIRFENPNGTFTITDAETGEQKTMTMNDVMAIKMTPDDTNLRYLSDLAPDYIIADGLELENGTAEISFILVFYDIPKNPDDTINHYQGRVFAIDTLVIEGYN